MSWTFGKMAETFNDCFAFSISELSQIQRKEHIEWIPNEKFSYGKDIDEKNLVSNL